MKTGLEPTSLVCQLVICGQFFGKKKPIDFKAFYLVPPDQTEPVRLLRPQDFSWKRVVFIANQGHFRGKIAHFLNTRRHGDCCYDGKSFTSFRENEGFVSYGIYSILEDKRGNMWFSTDKWIFTQTDPYFSLESDPSF